MPFARQCNMRPGCFDVLLCGQVWWCPVVALDAYAEPSQVWQGLAEGYAGCYIAGGYCVFGKVCVLARLCSCSCGCRWSNTVAPVQAAAAAAGGGLRLRLVARPVSTQQQQQQQQLAPLTLAECALSPADGSFVLPACGLGGRGLGVGTEYELRLELDGAPAAGVAAGAAGEGASHGVHGIDPVVLRRLFVASGSSAQLRQEAQGLQEQVGRDDVCVCT